MTDLPIQTAIPALREALAVSRGAVLHAPPGAGKTTIVPLALRDEGWLGGARIVMLEPRRLAARAAAARMARLLGEPVGRTVGYRIRRDTRVSAATRIEVVTEGVLTRMLQADPALDGVGLVIFDEFHERSLHADLGLALTLQARALLRDDLRILVMSATLDVTPVSRLVDGPVIASEGRAHDVEVRYLDRPIDGWIEPAVARTIRLALGEADGDVLVFLPGVGEIRRVEETLRASPLPAGVVVAPLYGDLSQAEQDRAIEPSSGGSRKVVLATAIAETSLTIEGVRVVVDSGLARGPRFSPRSGMTRLATMQVSAASAEQRRGRAGRLGPGVCYRLWTAPEQLSLVPHATPEIREADLAPLALELAAWGIRDPAELEWLDPPPTGALGQAGELLRELGAISPEGVITDHGRRMAALGAHPRIAHMLVRGAETGRAGLAALIAALLEERDPIRRGGTPDPDLRSRVALVRGGRGGSEVDRAALAAVRTAAAEWRRKLDGEDARDGDPSGVGALLALAYPDRIAQRRSGSDTRYLLRNGRGAALAEPGTLSRSEYLVAADLDDRGAESRIYLAAPLTPEELASDVGDLLVRQEEVTWDDDAGAVRSVATTRLGAIVVRESAMQDADPEAVADTLLHGIRQAGLGALPWSDAARDLRRRMEFVRTIDPAWPDVSDEALLATIGAWLRPFIYGMRRLSDLARLDLAGVLRGMAPAGAWTALDELAPSHVEVPSGSRIAIDYSDPAAPVLAVKLQEMFGATDTPRVGGDRVPLTLHLLSPARRPVQVTRDLRSFWDGTYFEVRKDLRGRYPKHPWPDDPMAAEPTRRTRRRG